MKKIINLKQAIKISSDLKYKKKKLVVTGGCFDILHLGHITLLEKSKKYGDYLFVFLENDKTIKRLKGNSRPINIQKIRALILASIIYVDYVVLLPEMKTNKDYDLLIKNIKPDFITNTKGDIQSIHNKRQAKLINAKSISVTNRINNKSTTNLAKIIIENFK